MINGSNYVPESVTEIASAVHSDITNSSYEGVIFMIDVTAHDLGNADESYIFTIEGKDELSSTYYTILASVNIRTGGGNGLYVLEVHPSLVEAANLKASNLLPDKFRLILTVGGTTPSVTYTVRVVLK